MIKHYFLWSNSFYLKRVDLFNGGTLEENLQVCRSLNCGCIKCDFMYFSVYKPFKCDTLFKKLNYYSFSIAFKNFSKKVEKYRTVMFFVTVSVRNKLTCKRTVIIVLLIRHPVALKSTSLHGLHGYFKLIYLPITLFLCSYSKISRKLFP